MTLYSPLRSQAGHVLRPPAQKPAHPGMSWAEHRRAETASCQPGDRPTATGQRILDELAKKGELTQRDIELRCKLRAVTVKSALDKLRRAGHVEIAATLDRRFQGDVEIHIFRAAKP